MWPLGLALVTLAVVTVFVALVSEIFVESVQEAAETFGMSQAFPPGQVIAPDQAAGILDYLAPEQIEGRDLDGRADQYSLACTGYELLCGTPPFGPDRVRSTRRREAKSV